MSSTTVTANNPIVLNDQQLAEIDSYAAALALLKSSGVAVETMADYGTGFKVVEKATLIGIDMLILSWRFNDGSYDGGFVSVEAITKHDEKVIFNDGSSGIRDQLAMVTAQKLDQGHKHPQAGLLVVGGLTKSSYFRNKAGDISKVGGPGFEPAETFYLAS
jgi:hypothetical protein